MIDSHGAMSVVTSMIYVQPVNDLPVVEEDIGSAAEEYIWNYYSISSLLSNDYDVDGDTLSIKNAHIVNGSGSVMISGEILPLNRQSGRIAWLSITLFQTGMAAKCRAD